MSSLGFCKVCKSSLVKEINKRLKRSDTYPSIVEWCKSHDFSVTRQKLADHKAHITDPKETLVDHAKRNPAIKNGVTEDEFSQAILDIAYQRAMENPDDITVNHGIQIVKVRAAKKQSQSNVLILLAQASRGRLSAPQEEMIEGEWSPAKELTTSG